MCEPILSYNQPTNPFPNKLFIYFRESFICRVLVKVRCFVQNKNLFYRYYYIYV